MTNLAHRILWIWPCVKNDVLQDGTLEVPKKTSNYGVRGCIAAHITRGPGHVQTVRKEMEILGKGESS